MVDESPVAREALPLRQLWHEAMYIQTSGQYTSLPLSRPTGRGSWTGEDQFVRFLIDDPVPAWLLYLKTTPSLCPITWVQPMFDVLPITTSGRPNWGQSDAPEE
jgi:hypothetical protein